jgi:archaellin
MLNNGRTSAVNYNENNLFNKDESNEIFNNTKSEKIFNNNENNLFNKETNNKETKNMSNGKIINQIKIEVDARGNENGEEIATKIEDTIDNYFRRMKLKGGYA